MNTERGTNTPPLISQGNIMKIYLATPYTHEDPDIRDYRFNIVNQQAGKLIQLGHIIYSPISMYHPIAFTCDLPKNMEYWQKTNETFLDWCDQLYVLRLSGWDTSKGVTHEILYCINKNKTIFHLDIGEEK